MVAATPFSYLLQGSCYSKGGEKLARGFANSFGAPLVVAHKQRDYSKPNTIESINILSAEPLDGKSLWVVDDMIDTAVSAEKLIRTLAL